MRKASEIPRLSVKTTAKSIHLGEKGYQIGVVYKKFTRILGKTTKNLLANPKRIWYTKTIVEKKGGCLMMQINFRGDVDDLIFGSEQPVSSER